MNKLFRHRAFAPIFAALAVFALPSGLAHAQGEPPPDTTNPGGLDGAGDEIVEDLENLDFNVNRANTGRFGDQLWNLANNLYSFLYILSIIATIVFLIIALFAGNKKKWGMRAAFALLIFVVAANLDFFVGGFFDLFAG